MGYRSGVEREQIIMPGSIDEYVGQDSAVRVIDACVEALDIEKLGFTKAKPASEGSPAYNPKDMLKLHLYGWMNRSRSSRQLEKATKLNMEVIWLMKGLQPDYRTIARFRQENATAMKEAFKATTRLFDKMGLFGKQAVSIDGSKFKADNSSNKTFTTEQLKKKEKALEERISKYLAELDAGDKEESADELRPDPDAVSKALEKLRNRKEEVQKLLNELKSTEETSISQTDRDCRLMKGMNGYVAGYNPQVATDTQSGMIAAYETTNHSTDQGMLSAVAKQAEETLNAPNLQVLADAGYDNPSDIARLVTMGMAPAVCSQDKIKFIDICLESDEDQLPEKHENGKCTYSEQRNLVICPMGKVLYPGYYNKHHRSAVFYNSNVCKDCPCRCTKEKYRKFMVRMKAQEFRKQYSEENLKLKQIRLHYATAQQAMLRRCTSEHCFGIIKAPMGFRECLLRGMKNVDAEFALAFTAYNIKRAITLLGTQELLVKLGSMGKESFYLLCFGHDVESIICECEKIKPIA